MPRVAHLAARHRSLLLLLGALAVTVTACLDAPEQSGDVTRGPAEDADIEIAAIDNDFDPPVLSAGVGEELTIAVTNEGRQPHNFVVADLDLSTGTLGSGEVATVRLTVPDGGVDFDCTLHNGMQGRITTD